MSQSKLLLIKQAFLHTTNTRFSDHTDWTQRWGLGHSTHHAESRPTPQRARTVGSLLKYFTGRTATSPTSTRENKSKFPTDRDWCNLAADGETCVLIHPTPQRDSPGQLPLPGGT